MRLRSRLGVGIAVGLLLSSWGVGQIDAQEQDEVDAQEQDEVARLIPYVPDEMNSIAVLRVRAIQNSPRGLRENWREVHEMDFLTGADVIPPWVHSIVRGFHLQPGVGGATEAVAVATVPPSVTFEGLAASLDAEVQAIEGLPAVRYEQRGGYVVEFDKPEQGKFGVFGAWSPSTRQQVARWIRRLQEAQPTQVSNYLQSASLEAEADIVMAVDLADLLDPGLIEYRLKGAEALAERTGEIAPLIEIFKNLEGLVFAAHVEDATHAKIAIDFDADIEGRGEAIHALLVEFLRDAGADLPEVAAAAPYEYEGSVVVEFELSDESLRRILSIVSAPPVATSGAVVSTREGSPRIDPDRTEQYVRSVNRFVDDLKKTYEAQRTNYLRSALWHEQYARRIEHLPTSRVALSARDYAANVAELLRALAASLRGVGLDVNELNRQIRTRTRQRIEMVPYTAQFGITYANPAWVTRTDSNLQQVREAQRKVIQETVDVRKQLWDQINGQRSALREELKESMGIDIP